VVGTALSLVFLVLAANFIVFQYGRGAVRAALDEGVRAGSVETGSASQRVATCSGRVAEVLDDLLRGPIGDGVEIDCEFDDGTGRSVMTARARARFRSWIPPVPDWRFEVAAVARVEDLS